MQLNPSTPEDALKLAEYVMNQADPELSRKMNFVKFIGNGTFSNVFLATLQIEERGLQTVKVAVKHLLNFNSPQRQATELKNLQRLRGKAASIATLFRACRWQGHLLMILPYIDCIEFNKFIEKPPPVSEIRDYLLNLLQALDAMHKQKLIHRDLKPANFLISKLQPGMTKRKYLLIDFGLAEDEIPFKRPSKFPKLTKENVSDSKSPRDSLTPVMNQRRAFLNPRTSKQIDLTPSTSKRSPKSVSKAGRSSKNPIDKCNCLGKHQTCNICHGNLSLKPVLKQNRRAGTAGFRPPEVLMRTPIQTTAIDIWCVGVILLSIITGKFPFFHGRVSDDVALSEITTLFGVKLMQDCSNVMGRNFISNCGAVRLKLRSLCNALRGYQQEVEVAGCSGKVKKFCSAAQCFHSDKELSHKSPLLTFTGQTFVRGNHRQDVKRDSTEPSSSGIDCPPNSAFISESSGSASDLENGCFVVEPCVGSEQDSLDPDSESEAAPTDLGYPDSLYHLLIELLDVNPFTRITAEDALKHPFIEVVLISIKIVFANLASSAGKIGN